MERPLSGALRGLCLEFGWSYALAWKTIGDRRPMRLVFEDGYCVQKPGMQVSETLSSSAFKEQEIIQSSQDGQMHMHISKLMASQAHVIGDGLVGEAVVSGSYRWLFRDEPNGFSSSSKGIADLSYQILADIQTIVIIPVLPFGVIQLGSTQMVLENSGFVNYVKRLFMHLNYGQESLPSDNVSSKRDQICSVPDANSSFSSANSRTKIYNLVNGCNHELVNSACKPPYSAVASQFIRMPPVGPEMISSQETIEAGKLILGFSTFKATNSLPSSLDDVKSSALFSGNASCKNANDNGSVSCLPCRSDGTTKSCDSIHISRTFNSLDTQTTFELSQDNHCCITSVPHSELTSVLNKKIAQASHDCSSQSGFLGSCSKLTPDTRQKHASSNSISDQSDQIFDKGIFAANDACTVEIGQSVHGMDDSEPLHASNHVDSLFPLNSGYGSDLFDLLGLNYMSSCLNGSLDDVFVRNNTAKSHQIVPNEPKTTRELDFCPTSGSLKDEISRCEAFSVTEDDQLLDAVISRISSGAKQGLNHDVSCKTPLSNICSSQYSGSAMEHDEGFGLDSRLVKSDPECSNHGPSTCNSINPEEYSQNLGTHKSQIHLWIENGQTIKYDSLSAVNDKKVTEGGKLTRKRPRPGENPRPRPKDRQMIQDRVKELREIVPNGAKCSIDALLEKTIKHMLFLQSVMKHADKLKDTGEPKISNEEGGLLLKDNFDGGATWAFEVGTQSMICPIIVEDLHPPRQLLVEMLCEERGFFLEIADFIKGLGLTILKGVMEARKNKVWARFAVEANRDVTRMDIFLSLIKLLEPGSASNITLSGTMNMPYTMCHQTSIPATGLPDHLQ